MMNMALGEDMIDVREYTDDSFQYGDLMSDGISKENWNDSYKKELFDNEKGRTERDKER